MKKIIIYHNPRCSKSRQALQILNDQNKNPQIIEYLKKPLTTAQLKQLLRLLGLAPRDAMRKNELLYKSLNLDNPKLTKEELISVLAENPILMERPIIVINDKAVIARPPEILLGFL